MDIMNLQWFKLFKDFVSVSDLISVLLDKNSSCYNYKRLEMTLIKILEY